MQKFSFFEFLFESGEKIFKSGNFLELSGNFFELYGAALEYLGDFINLLKIKSWGFFLFFRGFLVLFRRSIFGEIFKKSG